MHKESAPNRSQGREEKMPAASFFARCTAVVKKCLVLLALYGLLPVALVDWLLRVLHLEAA